MTIKEPPMNELSQNLTSFEPKTTAAWANSTPDSEQLLQEARRVLEMESEAVLQLSQKLGSSFVQAIQLLMKCSGKVVVTGIGKSGHVGNKIAATLASTGTPAFFVH